MAGEGYTESPVRNCHFREPATALPAARDSCVEFWAADDAGCEASEAAVIARRSPIAPGRRTGLDTVLWLTIVLLPLGLVRFLKTFVELVDRDADRPRP